MGMQGRIAAVVGSVVGSAVLAGIGALALLMPCDTTGFECLGVALIAFAAMFAGVVLGSLIGCYVGLRIRAHPHAGLTLLLLIGCGVAATVLCSVLAVGVRVPANAFIPIAVVCWLGLPFLARDLALRVRSKSDGSSDILGAPPAQTGAPEWTSSTAPKKRRSRPRSGSS